jgi:hypothetical protein
MNNIQKRFIAFLFGCILVRSFFVYLAYTGYKSNFLPLLGILALIPVIGWLNILFFNPRETGAEVFGEKIWWKDLRIVHMFLYILFSILALNNYKNSWIVLLIDVSIGLSAFLLHHYNAGDFKLLIE